MLANSSSLSTPPQRFHTLSFSGKMAPALWSMIAVLLFVGQGCNSGANGPYSGKTKITGNLTSCYGDSIRLYEISAMDALPLGAAKIEKKDNAYTFSMEVPIAEKGLYLLGEQPNNAASLVMGTDNAITVTGNCQALANSLKVEGSKVNSDYAALMQKISVQQNETRRLSQNLQVFQMTDPSQATRIQADLEKVNNRYFSFLDSVIQAGGFNASIAGFYNFKPFGSDPSHSSFTNDMVYFKDEFFKGVDLSDPTVGNIPQLFEKSRFYTQMLSSRSLPKQEVQAAVNKVLSQAAVGSKTHRVLSLGFLSGFEQSKSELYKDYGQQFVQQYPQETAQANAINTAIKRMVSIQSGAEAPEIAEKNPDGQTIKLSDFRGKYVMIDFWASWCRPCRMENPNVVKAYKKYKNKGFEVLGVSLDQKHDRWVAAIEQDQLSWAHVSDLQGWKSAPAADYNVHSIPATFLLDKEGKIIGKNLRGPALESKLVELFGE